MLDNLQNERDLHSRSITKAQSILTTADQVAEELTANGAELKDVTLELLIRPTSVRLHAFIAVRTHVNPLEAPKMKRKGSVAEAQRGISCYLQKAKEVAGQPVIAQMPEFEPPTIPKALQVPKLSVEEMVSK